MKKIISIALALVMALSLVSMTWATENQGTVNVSTLAELQQALNAAAAANSGNTTISLNDNITLGETDTWQPVNVDGYHGAGVVTLLGNKHTITGLNAPLFAGGFAGNSGIVIKDLTLSNVNLTDNSSTYASTGFGAFICAVDSMSVIELMNCHLVGGTITSTSGARVGGLIGWTSGYDNQNDGPVDTVIKITNCSVENCKITAAGSLGGLIGHAGANPATYHDITNCSVSGNTLKSTKSSNSNYTGALVGTVNSGQVTISGSSATENTLQQNANAAEVASNELLGRAVVNNTGLMIVDNKVVAAAEKYGVRAGDSTDALDRNETTGAWEKGTVKVAKIGNTTYPSLAEAVAAAKDGDTVTLLSNVSIDTPLNIAASITLELGDNTISYIGENARGIYIKNGADVTINANAAGGVTATTIALQVKAGGKLTVNGGVYNAQYAVAAFSSESAATETILNSGVFNGFIYTNGTGHDDHITINGGTYNKMLYLASGGKSTYTIKNGTFNTSLEIDAGTLNILGGTFKANVDTTNNANKPATNNNGSGAYEGIIVICKPDGSSSNGYIGDVVVNIKGGTFENTFPNGETIVVADFGKEEQGVGDAKVTISGSAKVIGKVVVYKSEDNTGAALAISGGTFSTDPSAYVTGDFTATKGPNGMWTVTQTVTPDPAPVDPQPERPAHTNRRYPANNTTTTTTDTKKDNVTSARTFDAGIAMYVGMSLLSVTGSAVVIGKKKEF